MSKADLINRQAAIDAIEEMQMQIMRSVFAEEQFVFKGMSEALHTIKALPSAQPELVAQGAYVRGFEQGRTQGMLDTKLQPTCNQLATDCISRQEAIDAIDVLKRNYPSSCFEDLCKAVDIAIKALSAQPEIIRCKDCVKREHCRTTNVWAIAPSDDWYCADAERRIDG